MFYSCIFVSHRNTVGKYWMGGVTAFFVISGFLITDILIKSKNSTTYFKSFYFRRVLRIFPIYYLLIIALIILFVFKRGIMPNDSFYYLSYTQNIFWIFNNYSSDLSGYLAHTWSLAIEEQFYLLWPLLIYIIPDKYLLKLIISTLLFSILFRCITILLGGNYFVVSILLPSQMDSLAVGALLSVLKSKNEYSIFFNKIKIISFLTGLVGIFGIILHMSVDRNISFMNAYLALQNPQNYLSNIFTSNIYFFLSLISVSIIISCIQGTNRLSKLLNNKVLTHLGKISYGLYLYHWPILVILKRINENIFFLLSIGFLLTYVVALISFNTIEVRFNRLKSKFVYL